MLIKEKTKKTKCRHLYTTNMWSCQIMMMSFIHYPLILRKHMLFDSQSKDFCKMKIKYRPLKSVPCINSLHSQKSLKTKDFNTVFCCAGLQLVSSRDSEPSSTSLFIYHLWCLLSALTAACHGQLYQSHWSVTGFYESHFPLWWTNTVRPLFSQNS